MKPPGAWQILTRDSPGEIPALHALRALAICLVLCFHFWLTVSEITPEVSQFFRNFFWHMGSGVSLFFVLSALLISGGLKREYETVQRLSFKNFYIRRSLRIFPAYYFFLGLTLAFLMANRARIAHATGAADPAANWYWDFLYLSNFLHGIHAHTWSLSIEEQFYLLFPLLAIFLYKLDRSKQLVVLGLVYVIPMFFRLSMIETSMDFYNQDGGLYLHTRLDDLIIGLFLTSLGRDALAKKFRPILLIASICLSVAGLALPDPQTPILAALRPNVVNIGFSGLVYAAWTSPLSWHSKTITAIARLSYSMYLWHMLAGVFAASAYFSRLKPGEHVSWSVISKAWLASLVITTILALLSFRFIEIPFLRLKDRLRQRDSVIADPSVA